MERIRQAQKFGEQRTLDHDVWYRILGEEVGEVARALNDINLGVSDVTDEDTRKELVQVAAVAISWLVQGEWDD